MAFDNATTSKQLVREAKIGLTVVALLFVVFVYVAAKRLSGGFDRPSKEAIAQLDRDTRLLRTQQKAEQKANKSNRSNQDPGWDQPGPESAKKDPPKSLTGKSNDNKKSEGQRNEANQNHLPITSIDSLDGKQTSPDENQLPPSLIESGMNLLAQQETPGIKPAQLPEVPTGQQIPNPSMEMKFETNAKQANEDLADNDLRSKFKTMRAPAQFDSADHNDKVKLVGGQSTDSGQFNPAGRKSNNAKPKSIQSDKQPDFADPPPLRIKDTDTVSKDALSKVENKLPNKDRRQPEQVWPYRYQATAKDSFWSIANKVYGNGQYFRALFQYNRQETGVTSIGQGTVIEIPSLKQLQQDYPELMPALQSNRTIEDSNKNDTDEDHATANQYTVSEGETLFSIAAEQLGQAARFTELMQLNRDRLPKNTNHLTRLPAGLRITLPKR